MVLTGLLLATGGLRAELKPVTDNLPGLPGQSDEWWAKRRQEQAEQQKRLQGQLVNLREVAMKQDVVYQENQPVNFYTGKPYDVDLGAYIFKFRNYSPETQRWSIADPSGFPDGANNYCYINSPIMFLDPDGRLTVKGSTTPNLATQTITHGNGYTYVVTAEVMQITSSQLAGELSIDLYGVRTNGSNQTSGVGIQLSVSGVQPISGMDFHWIQIGNCPVIIAGQTGQIFIDNLGGDTPFYDEVNESSSSTKFVDFASRGITSATPNNPVTWYAILYYVGANTESNQITWYDKVRYGFTITCIE